MTLCILDTKETQQLVATRRLITIVYPTVYYHAEFKTGTKKCTQVISWHFQTVLTKRIWKWTFFLNILHKKFMNIKKKSSIIYKYKQLWVICYRTYVNFVKSTLNKTFLKIEVKSTLTKTSLKIENFHEFFRSSE